MKKFLSDIKKTYLYYKGLRKKPQKRKSEQELCDLTVRPDVYAFLTCPGAVVEEMNLQP